MMRWAILLFDLAARGVSWQVGILILETLRACAHGPFLLKLFQLLSSEGVLILETLEFQQKSLLLVLLTVDLFLDLVDLTPERNVSTLDSATAGHSWSRGPQPVCQHVLLEYRLGKLVLLEFQMIYLLDQHHVFFQYAAVFLFEVSLVISELLIEALDLVLGKLPPDAVLLHDIEAAYVLLRLLKDPDLVKLHNSLFQLLVVTHALLDSLHVVFAHFLDFFLLE